MSLTQLNRRADMLLQLIDTLKSAVEVAPMEKAALTKDDLTDCWAFLLALQKGGTVEAFAQQEPDCWARLQERFLTEVEQTEARLAHLPFGDMEQGQR